MMAGVAALVLLAAVMHASWNVLLRSGQDRLWSGAAISVSAGVACLIAVPFLPLPHRASWFCIVLSAVIHVGYQLLLVKMYQAGEFGITYPVARGSSPLLISLGGAVLANEYLDSRRLLGVILISGGILTLAAGSHQVHRESILAALATGISIALYSLTDGIGGRLAGNAPSYTAWVTILCGIGVPAVSLWIRKQTGGPPLFRRTTRVDALGAFGGGVISVVAYGIVIWAMQRTPMGVVSALRETSVLFAAFLGRVFLGEPFTIKKTVAAALICAGLFCLR